MAKTAKPKKGWAITDKEGEILSNDYGDLLVFRVRGRARDMAWWNRGHRIARVLITEI